MMEIEEDDILRNVANGDSMDYSVWPALLPRIVSRIEKIARDEFPIPRPLPSTIVPSSIPHPTTQPESDAAENFLSPLPFSPVEASSSASSQDTNKENTPAAPRTAALPTPAPISTAPLPPGTLPPQIVHMLTEITSTLKSTFPTYPPHTIQRLSELIIAPKHHYRSLATYLHALDRVVHVTSGLNIYPLPPAVSDISPGTLLPNGTSENAPVSSHWAAPGSDEALGGALLTPIPWLQPNHQAMSASPQPQPQSAVATPDTPNQPGDLEGEVRTESTETIDGPNGVGSIETVSVSVNGIPSMGARGVGVTQATPPSSSTPSSATLDEEEREEGATPAEIAAAQDPANAPVASVRTTNAEDEEKPHARGPEEIGPNDLGPQSASSTSTISGSGGVEMQGIDLQAAVGRKAVDNAPARSSPDAAAGKEEQKEGEGRKEENDGEQMDVEMGGQETLQTERATTPKREAENGLGGATSKRLKEDEGAVGRTEKRVQDKIEVDEGKQEKDEDAMDKD